MDILSDEQYQVLGFVGACNRNFYNPTARQVMLWRDNPTPAEAVHRTVRRQVGPSAPAPAVGLETASSRMLAAMIGESLRPMQEALASFAAQNFGLLSQLGHGTRTVTEREIVKPAETMIEHLVRLTWLEEIGAPRDEDPGLRLTNLGRALIRDVEMDMENDEDVSVVVLGREDPLAYPTLVGQLAASGEGLLVDPYLKLPDLHTIVVQHTTHPAAGVRQDQQPRHRRVNAGVPRQLQSWAACRGAVLDGVARPGPSRGRRGRAHTRHVLKRSGPHHHGHDANPVAGSGVAARGVRALVGGGNSGGSACA